MRKQIERWMPIGVVMSLLVLWEVIVRVRAIPLYVLPPPSKVLQALMLDFNTLLGHSYVTFMEAIIGIGIALVLAILLGVGMDAFPLLKKSIYPILVVTQTVPMIVLAPIFIIYLGFGVLPKILTVVLMCFFPVVMSLSEQMSQMDKRFIYLIQSYGGTRKHVYALAKIPAALPALFSGLKVAATYSIGGAVVGEWIASQSGLGYYLLRVKNAYMLDKVFACVIMIVALSLLMNGLVGGIGHLLMKRTGHE